MVVKKQRFEIIKELRKRFPLKWLVKIGEVSRAGYYKWLQHRKKKSKRNEENKLIQEHILAIHKLHPYYGYNRMKTALFREGMIVNHKRVRRLMRVIGIQSVIRKKRPFYGKRHSITFKNVLDRQFQANKPYEKLVTDITYIRTGDTFTYLSAILDLYNNEIVAWEMSERNDLELVTKTINQLKGKSLTEDIILHSDQGFQYTSKSYAKQLKDINIQGSHSRRGNCHDNACIESFFSHIKAEKLYLVHPKTPDQAYQAVREYIDFYNHERFQQKFNGLSPIEYREKAAA